jgi:predicted DCC family thiol-disulfide oxidoreductase YuxK
MGIKELFELALIVPSVLRDPIYNAISKNRYKLMGEMDGCRFGDEEFNDRFVPDSIFDNISSK